MYRARLSLAFAALVTLVCIQAAFVYWGANRVNDYAQHSRPASDIQSELLDLSANKQRLRVWAMQRLMNTDAQPEQRERLVAAMYASTANLDGQYTVFGKVTQGMDVALQIRQGDKVNSISITEQ